ncbi:MerR family transcriptional regulator [Nocardiopsis alkaliphila]|uniref:MerR family transcriptional regulator n=1 Tax=Nocardiopsis alkaliphila TaxID=225762 RepID=UPI00034D0C65|nr:MerR family transcriptional regulator [Nocardiopsis alkaliphila]
MRISELSERSGVSVASIKYYLREGLLHRGERTSPNQARYDESHLHRLRLIGALTDVGGMSVAATRELLAMIDGERRPELQDLMGSTLKRIDAQGGHRPDVEEADLAEADALTRRHGWYVHAGSPLREELARVITAFHRSGFELDRDWLDGYAEAAEQAARRDHDLVSDTDDLDEILKIVVVGTVLGERLLATLRRLAQASEAQRRHGDRRIEPRS